MRESTLWFDVTDLVRHYGTWTGIQRVVAGFASGLQVCPGPFALRYCHFQPNRGFVALDAAAVEQLIHALHWLREKPQRSWLARLRARIGAAPTLVDPFATGDWLLNVGLFTYKDDWRPVVAKLLERQRIRYVGFVHDLMHLNFPEWWAPREQERIVGWYRFVANQATALLCASAATRSELERFLANLRPMVVPIITTGLAGALLPQAAGESATPMDLVKPPYVLFVSTVEVRKNHRLLFYLWRRLREQLGDARLPTLVWVGKRGHLSDDLLTELANCRYLDGKVKWLQRVDDGQLIWLYRHSLFTVYPSLYEGWGLPVAESLALGKYCIAATSGALPEVGGDLIDYHDPLDLPQALELITRAILDPAYVAAKESAIVRTYRPLSWSDCVQVALAGLAATAPASATQL